MSLFGIDCQRLVECLVQSNPFTVHSSNRLGQYKSWTDWQPFEYPFNNHDIHLEQLPKSTDAQEDKFEIYRVTFFVLRLLNWITLFLDTVLEQYRRQYMVNRRFLIMLLHGVFTEIPFNCFKKKEICLGLTYTSLGIIWCVEIDPVPIERIFYQAHYSCEYVHLEYLQKARAFCAWWGACQLIWCFSVSILCVHGSEDLGASLEQ